MTTTDDLLRAADYLEARDDDSSTMPVVDAERIAAVLRSIAKKHAPGLPDLCQCGGLHSRICERGTKGCTCQHAATPPTRAEGPAK